MPPLTSLHRVDGGDRQGSKFKAVENHRDRTDSASGKMKTRMALIEESIAQYLMHLDRMDRKENTS